MMRITLIAWAALLAVTAPAWAGRYAMVIGNGAYQSAPLKNPKNDAVSVAKALRNLEFTVTEAIDLNKAGLESSLAQFVKQLKSPDDVALLFYAGHGIQYEGRNYLLPVDANITDPEDLVFKAIPMDLVLQQIAKSKALLTIAFFDACRDNPFRARVRSQTRGLAAIQSGGDAYIVYATDPNDVAIDGDGDNSPFTKALTDVLKAQPNVPIEQIFKLIAKKVRDQTGGRQRPWSSGSLEGDFYFKAPTRQETQPQPIEPARAADPNVFSYYPPGDLIPGSGEGSRDYKIWAPDIVFPVAAERAFVNSQVYGNGGALGPKETNLCDRENYSYPWRDNFCEKRSFSAPACPSGTGKNSVSIRGPDCKKNVYPVVAVEAGQITKIGSYSVTLSADSGRKWNYLHMEPSSLKVKVGDSVKSGQELGKLSNAFGGSPTSVQLSLELSVSIASPSGEVQVRKVSPYMSLVRAYERKVGRGVEISAGCTPAAPQGARAPQPAPVRPPVRAPN